MTGKILSMQSDRINKNSQQCDARLICDILRHRKAIVLLLVMISSFLFSSNIAAQCGPGKISETIQGFGSILTANTSFSNGSYALGGPNGSGANFSTGGQYIIVDLIDTVKAGQTYSITWRQYPGETGTSILNWSESLDGTTFVVHPSSGLGTTNERYFTTDIVAATDTRYVRIFTTTTQDLNVDAISFNATKCYTNPCGPGFSSQLISGNGTVSGNNSITNPNNTNYVPDGNGATFNSNSSFHYSCWPKILYHLEAIRRQCSDGNSRIPGRDNLVSDQVFSITSDINNIYITPRNSWDSYKVY
jgi:hypothetical protein